MKNKDISDLFAGLKSIGNLEGFTLNYAIAKNIRKLQPEIETMESLIKATPEFVEQDKKRIAICERFSDKDEQGKPKTKTTRLPNGNTFNRFVFNDSFELSKEAIDAIEELKKSDDEFKIQFELRDKQIKDYNDFLEKESSFDIYKVRKEDVPEKITTIQMNIIYPLILEI